MPSPGEDIHSWSPTAANNGTADTGINWIEGMPRADVNNSSRSMMAAIAKDRNLKNGSIVTAGTANAQIFSSGLTPPYTTIPTGMRVKLKIGAALTNTDAATLSMDGIAAVAVKNNRGLAIGAGVLLAGAYLDFLYDGTNWIILTDTGAGVVPQCGRLSYGSSTSLTFTPFNGEGIQINGQVFRIPSAGIVGLANTSVFVNGVAGQNLAADTLYYVYVFSNAAVVTADFRTGTHATSSTLGNAGAETLSGDDSRTLIGMVKTVGVSFASDTARRNVISWFNRRNIAAVGARVVTTSNGAVTELSPASRAAFLAWGDEAIQANLAGSARATSPGIETTTTLGLDGAAMLSASVLYDSTTADYFMPVSASGCVTVSEGAHYVTPMGGNNGGGSLWDLCCSAMTRG